MKPIIDEIDKVLTKHGVYPAAGGRFTPAAETAGKPEELDVIPPKGEARRTGIPPEDKAWRAGNYDIKYRMGKELSGEGEDE